jgi:exocyst complex component 1
MRYVLSPTPIYHNVVKVTSQAFGRILDQICPLTYKEEEFLSNFLQINETGETFADYMNLDSYFRRQAARWAGVSRETQKLLRGSMDLIFSFLPEGLKKWIDDVLELDKL